MIHKIFGLLKLTRKGSNFIGMMSKLRKVTILNGGRKIVVYKYRLFGIPIYTKTINFGKVFCLDGGGALQYSLSESFIDDDFLNEKISCLVDNLDDKSKETVYKIIDRLSATYYHKYHLCESLTNIERSVLEDINLNFQNRIYKVGDFWYYDGFYLPISAFEISVFFHKHSMHILSNHEKLKNKDIIDVGAYVGDSALILSQYTNKKVYSFEIDKNNFTLLKQTIKLNDKYDKIIPLNIALGKDNKNIHILENGIGAKIVDNNSGMRIKQLTLDSFVKENNIKVGFIKVDIEGAEMDFLLGAKNTICSQKPSMLISIYHNPRDFFKIKPMLESWNLGYTFKIYKPIDYTISVETALYCEFI